MNLIFNFASCSILFLHIYVNVTGNRLSAHCIQNLYLNINYTNDLKFVNAMLLNRLLYDVTALEPKVATVGFFRFLFQFLFVSLRYILFLTFC